MNVETQTETTTTIELDEEEVQEAIAYWLYHWKGWKIENRKDIDFDCHQDMLRLARVQIIDRSG